MFLIPEPGNGGTKYTGKPADQGVGAILDSRVDSSETMRVATRRSYFTVTSSHQYQESKENISSKSSFCG